MGQNEAGTLAALKAHRRELIDREISSRAGASSTRKAMASWWNSRASWRRSSARQRFKSASRTASQRTARRAHRVPNRRQSRRGHRRWRGHLRRRGEHCSTPGGVRRSRHGLHLERRIQPSEEPGGYAWRSRDAGVQEHCRTGPCFALTRPDRRTDFRTAHSGEVLLATEKPSIAILPFANLSGDPAQDYLAEGLRLDIQATLVHASGCS